MSKRNSLIGQKFGNLTILAKTDSKTKYGHYYYKCLCDCGNEILVIGNNIRKGNTKSCGCLRRKVTGDRARKHGMKNTRLNRIWRSIKYRCSNPNAKDHTIYYDRGITVCDEWKNDFKAFYDWAMANGYRDDLTIDRIDNDKGYSPDNCRWATAKEQRLNQRRCND